MPAHRVGRPRLGFDMDAETIPQEAGINERAVELREGLLRGPGDGRAAALQGQAEPPPARPAALGAGRAAPRSCWARRWSAGSAPPASPRGRARSRSRSCAARRPPATRCWSAAPRRAWPSCRSSVTERRAPRPAAPSRTASRARAPCSAARPAERPRHALPAERARAPSSRPSCATCASWCRRPSRSRQLDDWGRSQRVFDLVEPLLDFYYRHWFRVETEGIEHVPAEGGALLVSNHSGALPPDAPMIMQAIRHEHPARRGRSTCSASTGSRAIRAWGCSPTRSAWWRRTRPTPSACSATRGGSCWSSPRARRARASSTGSATGCAASGAAGSCAPRCAPACRSCRWP